MAREAAPATQALARIAADVRYESLPPTAAAAVARNLADTVGCILAGSRTAVATSVRDTLASGLGSGDAAVSVLGTPVGLPAPQAAFANAVAAHALELDDTDARSFCHAGAVVIPAVLAIAERERCDGPATAEGIVAGYEVTLRLARWVNPAHRLAGFHTTATIPTIGAAAAVARLLGGSVDAIANAIAVGCSFAGGTFAFLDDGANIKRVHAGKASFSGVLSALLAAGGVTGPRTALDGRAGLYATMAGPEPPALDLGDIGTPYLLERVGHKPHPCCRFCHAPIDAGIDLHRPDRGLHEVEDVLVQVSRLCLDQTGDRTPANELQRQFSTPYGVALAVLNGEVRLSDYSSEPDNDALRLAKCTRIRVDDSIGATDRQATVTVRWTDGTRTTSCAAVPLGEPEHPLPADRLRRKFVDLASSVLPESSVRRSYSALLSIGRCADVRPVLRTMSGTVLRDT